MPLNVRDVVELGIPDVTVTTSFWLGKTRHVPVAIVHVDDIMVL